MWPRKNLNKEDTNKKTNKEKDSISGVVFFFWNQQGLSGLCDASKMQEEVWER